MALEGNLLQAQDFLVGKALIAANHRRYDEWRQFREDYLEGLSAFPSANSETVLADIDIEEAYGPLTCWTADDETVFTFLDLNGDFHSQVDVPSNVFYYAPYDYPTEGVLVRTRKVVRFVVMDYGTPFTFGLDLLPFLYGDAAAIGDYYEVQRLRKWVIDIPTDVTDELAGDDVLVVGGQQSLSATKFLQTLTPDRPAIGENFVAMDVLNIVLITTLEFSLKSLTTFPNPINTLEPSYDVGNNRSWLPTQPELLIDVTGGYGDVDTNTETYWTTSQTPGFGPNYTTDKDRFVDAHAFFPRHRTVIYYDQHIAGQGIRDPDPQPVDPLEGLDGQTNVATRITGLLGAIASDLSQYNVSYGGTVDWQTTTASSFLSLIRNHFELE